MADIITSTSTYQTGTNDTASTVINNVTAMDAAQPNGIASAAVQIETILGTGTDLKGTAADLVARLAVLLQASGNIKDKDGGTSYSKWDGWMGYGTNTLKKVPNLLPPGFLMAWSLTNIPSGWLECNAQQVNCTTYIDLFDAVVGDLDLQGTTIEWKRGTAAHTTDQATNVNTGTDTITATAHGLSTNNVVHLSSSGTIPGGLATRTKYYLVNVTANTYQLSLTEGGSAVDITSTGSGTLSVYTTFQLPDYRGRSPIGAGTGSGLTNRVINTPYGEEDHVLTLAEINHNHDGTNRNIGSGVPVSLVGDGGNVDSMTGGPSGHNTVHPVFGTKWVVRT